MSYQALARKWRPQTFAEVVGQEHVVSALSNALASGRVHHAYLFTGTRGVGKTTLARIFAKALNCETGVTATPCGECAACRGISEGSHVDLIEVDAASRTKVEDTRDLLENVQYAPTVGRFKIYLIDEVHMLSSHSFNALLKTLEEPPEHVKFLLATTDPQKLPATILSRCIQFNLKAMDIRQLSEHLGRVLKAEGVDFDPDAVQVLARSADGSVRDSLSLMDQAIAFGDGEVRAERVREMLGMIDDRFTLDLLQAVVDRDGAAVLQTIDDMAGRAVDFRSALDDVLSALHNAALYQVNADAVAWKGVDTAAAAELADLADAELLQLLYQVALVGKRDLNLAPDPRSGFEMALLRMTVFQPNGEGSPTATTGEGSARPAPGRIQRPGRAATGKEDAASRRSAGPGKRAAPARATAAEPPASGQAPSPATDRDPVVSASVAPPVADNAPEETPVPPAGLDDGAAPADPAAIHSPEGWAAFANGPGLRGISRELVMHMVPSGFRDGTLALTLDAASKHLFNPDRVKKIQQLCCDHVGTSLRLEITVDSLAAGEVESPAMLRDRAVQERQQEAETAFREDPNVRELVDRFDAEIVADSIRPPTG